MVNAIQSNRPNGAASLGQIMAEIVLREHGVDPVAVSLDTSFGQKVRELIEQVDMPVRAKCRAGRADKLPDRIEAMMLDLRILISRLLSP